ncbi:hypothetical protein P154DRAFT_575348 [Amniculicola lignicola CBS 123094]|uniref:Uncharacterized protein n=1 Tax=Amniculicola lignicola CBS 123094 TaxID=1392246 RepID=A0A6A5WHY4_9PLEO|nr:hypothetical protein P154DRAFT_575348 [Amniculicola lignicola CBS 123094]
MWHLTRFCTLPFLLHVLASNAIPLKFASTSSWLVAREASTSITASNEVWATVIVNIGPLVTLVGEQNFKAYLKDFAPYIQLRNVGQNTTFNGTMGRSLSATIDEIVAYSSTGYDFFNVSAASVSPNADGQPDSATASLNSHPSTTPARPASVLDDSGGAPGDALHEHQLGETRNPRRIPRHIEHRLGRMTRAEIDAFWRSFDHSEDGDT